MEEKMTDQAPGSNPCLVCHYFYHLFTFSAVSTQGSDRLTPAWGRIWVYPGNLERAKIIFLGGGDVMVRPVQKLAPDSSAPKIQVSRVQINVWSIIMHFSYPNTNLLRCSFFFNKFLISKIIVLNAFWPSFKNNIKLSAFSSFWSYLKTCWNRN